MKKKAVRRAKALGFSSIQEVLRLFIAGFNEGKYSVGITGVETPVEIITDEEYAVLEKRQKELEEAVKKGEIYVAHSVEEMMDTLDNAKID